MSEIALSPPTSPDINTAVTDYVAGSALDFATTLQNNQDTLEGRDAFIMAALEALTAAFGYGSLSGGAVSAGTGLSVNVASLTAMVGNWIGFDASQIVGGLTDSATNSLFLRQDGTWTANTTGTLPSADGHGAALLWGTATTSGGSVTGVTNVRRSFLQNRAEIPLLTAAPTNAVAGDVYGRTDTTTLHIEGLGDFTTGGGGTGNLTFRGAYNTGTTYAANDLVIGSDGLGYIAIGSTVGHAPPNVTYWTPIGSKGDTGATGATGATGPAGAQGLTWRGAWSSLTTYAAYDLVSYSGSAYIAIAATTNDIPVSSPSKWDVYASGAAGVAGADGADGTNGATIDNGAGVPSSGTGANGDYYIDLNTGDLYYKTGGSWGVIFNLVGKQGTTGLQGAAGATGQGVPTGGTSGQVLAKNSSTDYDTHWTTPAGSGTVTSVAMTVPTGFSVSGSPVTTSGTLAVSENTQSANTVKAGPTSGAAATPGYRALVAADIPALDAAKVTTGVFGIGRLATGTPTGSKFVRDDGTLAVPSSSAFTSFGSPNVQTASYTLVLSDAGAAIDINSSTPCGLTIPPNSSVAFPIGTFIVVTQTGSGTVTIGTSSPATMHTRGGLTNMNGQYSVIWLRKDATDLWYVWGDLA